MKYFESIYQQAKSNLDARIWQYLEDGADGGLTARRNISDFDNYRLLPEYLVDVSKINMEVNYFGRSYAAPMYLSPIGSQNLFHASGELASAKAAQKAGLPFVLSTVSHHSYEAVSNATETPPWFQLYPTPDRAATRALIDYVSNLGAEVLVCTIDVPTLGNRSIQRLDVLSDNTQGNLEAIAYSGPVHDASMDWSMIDWIRDHTDMSLVIKGIATQANLDRAYSMELDGVIISNHGGRQLDSGMSSISSLDRLRIYDDADIWVGFDGGIRSARDVFIARSLGAQAIGLGRSYCYGLAANGQQGVLDVLEYYKENYLRTLQLMGIANPQNINRRYLD